LPTSERAADRRSNARRLSGAQRPRDRYDRLFVMEAMMQMVKLDVGNLEHTYQGAE
jgi:hypothetical protein